jgi:predicted alpha/beta superfamily hydrolase
MNGSSPFGLSGTEAWDHHSATTGRSYRIFVSRPEAQPPPGGYPTVFVTDANLFFATAAEQARTRALIGDIAPALIVGIGYPTESSAVALQQRLADLVPAADSGRAVSFKDALETEIVPMVERAHGTNPRRRGLFGFSLGGLLVLDLAQTRPTAFSRYVAASPSIWWGNRTIDHICGVDRRSTDFEPARLLMTVGSLEQSLDHVAVPPGYSREQAIEQIRSAKMVDNARAAAHEIGCALAILDGETHASAPAASIGRALGFLLQQTAQA